jgi:hypothetical protein
LIAATKRGRTAFDVVRKLFLSSPVQITHINLNDRTSYSTFSDIIVYRETNDKHKDGAEEGNYFSNHRPVLGQLVQPVNPEIQMVYVFVHDFRCHILPISDLLERHAIQLSVLVLCILRSSTEFKRRDPSGQFTLLGDKPFVARTQHAVLGAQADVHET